MDNSEGCEGHRRRLVTPQRVWVDESGSHRSERSYSRLSGRSRMRRSGRSRMRRSGRSRMRRSGRSRMRRSGRSRSRRSGSSCRRLSERSPVWRGESSRSRRSGRSRVRRSGRSRMRRSGSSCRRLSERSPVWRSESGRSRRSGRSRVRRSGCSRMHYSWCSRSRSRHSGRSCSRRSESSRCRGRRHSQRLREREHELDREREHLRQLERAVRRSEGSCNASRQESGVAVDEHLNQRVDSEQRSKQNLHRQTKSHTPSFSAKDIYKIIQCVKNSGTPQSSEQGAQSYNKLDFKNILPDFDPSTKNQRMDVWLRKVNECASVYGWDEKTTIHFSLQKLQGLAKVWYQSLNSVLFKWSEWQEKLLKAFPCDENYGQSLEDMLRRKNRLNEPMGNYFYEKLALINQCEISGKRAVDCIIHGLTDKTVKSSALALQCSEPDQLLQFLLSNKDSNQTSFRYRNSEHSNMSENLQTNRFKTTTTSSLFCFNCKERGHPYLKCSKPLIKCDICHRVGHKGENCLVKKDSQATKINNIPRAMCISSSSPNNKYIKLVTVNDIRLEAFIDFGSEVTLIRESSVTKLGILHDGVPTIMKGFGNTMVQSMGSVTLTLAIDGVAAVVLCKVMPDTLLDKPMLVGQTFTEQPHVVVFKDANKLEFHDVSTEVPSRCVDESNSLMQPPPVVHAPPQALPPPTAAHAPPASHASAPRTIVIQRPDARHGFGFTLRHLVVYPPESIQDLYDDARLLAVGAVGAPMDTIFVRSVRPGGPAAAAGLRAGDRVLAVNGEPVACGRSRAPYARVVQLAQREPRVLRLTVVPRDHDLLQRYFSEAAYNPETNQRPIDMPAPVTEHESRLFDAYRRPRAALPAPQAPARHREDPEYASVASLAPSRYDRLPGTPHYLMHDGRRESDTSLPSSATESKDSLGSFDSNSTLTGRELDDSIILSRIRKSLEQKEAFLRRPSQPTGWVTPDAPPPIKQKEFYARPQKLQKPAWPPPAASPPLAASPPPQPQLQQEERKDECSASVDSGTFSGYGEVNGAQEKSRQKQDKNQFVSTLSKIQETAPSIQSTNVGTVTNGSQEMKDEASANNQENKYPVTELQLVTARTRQLEEARGGWSRRTETARSELARLSTTRLQPSVALRRREFETRTSRRDARSLDVQAPHELEHESPLGGSLSGNQLMITGSKHLHCPPPEGYVPETEKVQMRTRSNSTGSDGIPIRRHHASDGSHAKRRMGLNKEQMEAMNRVSLAAEGPARPTQLSLAPPSASTSASASAATSPSPTPSTPADSGFADDLVTRRQKKDAQLGEEERAMRRVSYLKATWGDRLHLDSDVEPDSDPQGLRGVRKWRPPRFTDDITPLLRIFDPQAVLPARSTKKDEEETSENAVETTEGDLEGNVQVKMVVCNGKRASDRSWKQVWAVLHGTKLYLYRHHPSQSPGAVTGAGTDAQQSRDALDVRYSLAALADDYTKRKHVVRVTTAAGAELLLQAEGGAADAQRWLAALRRHSAEPPPADPAPQPATPAPLATQQDCPSPLPPQRTKKIGRNRSPTGPPTPTLPSSPKNKTWKGRMAKQLRRMHGGTATAAAPTTGWLGAPLERCPADAEHPCVPRAVTLPAHAVEAYGLRTVGVYRVPGNAAGVAALAAALDRGEPPPSNDARWADVHVASSLLKAYLRRLPDPLLTADLYPAFIAADRSPERARELRRLVQALPEAHYETLKYLIQHLRRVVAHSAFNKMEARNLAIVFGPTLVRAASDDMLAMVNDMSSQCRIIESFLTHYEWYFEEEEGDPPTEPPTTADELSPAPAPSRDLLIHNVKKMEGKDVSTRDIVSSIISAANRKIQRKPRSKPDKKSEDKRDSPGGSPPSSPLTSPPHHLTTSLADYDGLNHKYVNRTQDDVNKIEIETMTALGRGRQEISRHTHTLNNFSIDGTGDLVSSLTSTFDQKLRTLNNSSPLDDGSIPYADECQDEAETKSGESSPSDANSERDERVSPAARAHDLKTAWLARDHRHSSSSSADEPERVWPRPRRHARDDNDDSEKENCEGPRRGDNEAPAPAPPASTTADERKRSSTAPEPAAADDDAASPKRSSSLGRSPERGTRVLRSESVNCREPTLRRREAAGCRGTKLKRKNGMPERGIKRRHTVGGTKDFDKDGWSARHTRTSSPDLTWPAPLVPPPRHPLESHV